MNWEKIGEKVKEIIIEKKPTNLTVTLYKNEVYIYTDEGLVEKIAFQEEKKVEEKTVEEKKSKRKKTNEK